LILDASALLAVLFHEPEQSQFLDMILTNDTGMSVIGYMEIVLRLERLADRRFSDELDDRLAQLKIRLQPVSVEQAKAARLAFQRFGKGVNPAGLNLGDCFAYALAKVSGEPLLYKGEDFARTDIPSAL
jgi:ribonuclease VapC